MTSDQRLRARAAPPTRFARTEALWLSRRDSKLESLSPRAVDEMADSVLSVFCACFICAVAVRYFSLFPSVIDPDESLYLIIAQHWLQGELPYSSVWDHHSVGLPGFFAAIQYLFPTSIVAIRLSASVAVAATATTIYFMSRLVDGRYLSSILAAAFYIAWSARSWGLPANCELYLNALVAPAMFVLLRQLCARPKSIGGPLCLSALLLGIACHVKHVIVIETALFFVGAFVVLWKTPGRWRIFSAAILSFAFPSVVVVGYFYAHGLTAEYLRAVVLSNLVYAGSHPSFGETLERIPQGFVVLLLAVAAAAGVISRRRELPPAFILLWAVAACADVALPGQYWPHYFLLVLPAASILVGYLASVLRDKLLWHIKSRRAVVASVTLLVLLLCNPISVYRDIAQSRGMMLDDVPRTVSAHIVRQLSPNDYVFVFDYQPVVYWMTDARLPTKHVLPADWWPEFQGVSGVDPISEIAKVFSRRPAFVVVSDKGPMGASKGARSALDRALSSHYELESEVQDARSASEPVMVKIYRRK